MHFNSTFFNFTKRLTSSLLHFVTGITFFCFSSFNSNAQICPPNIDFENGTFDGWTCHSGTTSAGGGVNQISLSPSGAIGGRHTMLAANSGQLDPYGGFPVNCPNGSGYSIKLGNDLGGTEAEGVSYEFTIPAGQNVYSLIYHYAVVFEDPNHQQNEQPRMQVEITNVSDNYTISCASFSFIPYGSSLPGFLLSSTTGDDGTAVWYKNWSAVSINLDNLAGKSIKLFFKTADCTFRRHFGYAYVDVNSECSSEFVGATYCADDTAVTVTAPYGYQTYTWYNSNFTQVLGTQQSILFSPPPLAGTTVAVQIVPYNGYGCMDTLYAQLIDTLTVKAFAGPDQLYCGINPVSIGVIPKPGLVYSWSPATGLNNPNIANPLASPGVTTTYVLSVRNNGGGCLSTDTVIITSSAIDNTLELIGRDSYCIGSKDSAILKVKQADMIQWYKDGVAIAGATQNLYKVSQSGNYYALLVSNLGCIITTVTQRIFIDQPRPGITYPIEFAVIDKPYTLQARDFGITVLWNPALYLNNPSLVKPVFKNSFDQLYTIRIETATGCVTIDTQLVKTIKYADIFVPTAFTPNNDGLNDILKPILMGIKELRYFRVFNRWGQLLFESKSTNKGWDGKINGIDQATGTIVWMAEAQSPEGIIYTRKGTCILIR